MEQAIVNKVAQSGLITIDLADFKPTEQWVDIDICDFLEEGILLREKSFRTQLEQWDTSHLQGKIVRLFQSEDAIIPQWAWMLLTIKCLKATSEIYTGTKEDTYITAYIKRVANALNNDDWNDQRIVIKGCGDFKVPHAIYAEAARCLYPRAKSILFGEPCSTVPVFKKPRL